MFKCFNIVRLFACFLSTFIYPYFTLIGFPHYYSVVFWLLVIVETIFLVEIILSFFVQKKNQAGIS